jgi:putative flippase GtrA
MFTSVLLPMLEWKTLPPFLRFLAVGVLNTAFGYCVFVGGVLLGLPAPAALGAAYVLGVLFNFLSTGKLVFDRLDARALPRFIGAYLLVYAVNLGALAVLVRAGLHEFTAQAIALPFMAALSFVIFRSFVFRAG